MIFRKFDDNGNEKDKSKNELVDLSWYVNIRYQQNTYDSIKSKYQGRAKLCYMNTNSFVIYITTEDCYKDVTNDVGKRFDASNYDEDDKRPLPISKNKKKIGFFKDELGGKIMKIFVRLRAKTWAYLMNNDGEHKKTSGTKKSNKKRTYA